MDPDGIKLRPLESDADVEEELALMRLAFPDEKVDELVERLLMNHPGFSRGSFLTAWQGGRMVASLCLIPLTWSVGGVPLKVAEMGMVATHPDYRRRGIQRLLNAEYDKIAVAEGYDLSVIEGIPYFYRQFGYEYTIPLDSETIVPLERLLSDPGNANVRPFEEGDIPATMELMRVSQERLLVHSVRSREIWEAQQRTGWQGERRFDGYILKRGSRPVAHFRVGHQGESLCLIEASVADEVQARDVLGFLKRLGENCSAKSLVSRVSHDDVITKGIVAVGGELNRPYGWQVKVIDYKRLLEKICPLLSRRLKASQYADLTDTIKINLYRRCLAFVIENGEVVKIEDCESERGDGALINPIVFPKLLLGVRDVAELMREYPDVIVAARYRGIIDTLLPKGESFIHTCY